jgi:CBS domain-containing protein
MQCREIMKEDVQCISESETIQAAARKMRDANIGFLPVLDGAQRVCGTVTDRDLAIRALAEARLADSPVSSVMSHDVVACKPDDDLAAAESLMTSKKKSRVMCLDEDGKIAGVISLSDIAQAEGSRKAAKTLRGITQREART